MSWKTALSASVLIGAATFAQETHEPIARVSIIRVEERPGPDGSDDQLGISVRMACENCEAVPDDQCVDAIISWPDGRYLLRHPRKALSPDFVLFLPFGEDAVRIELAEHEGHSPGKPPSRTHRGDGCVAGPELTFGEPMVFDLRPREPTVSTAGANIKENPDDDGRLWVFVYMECENCESVPEGQCVDALISWNDRSPHRLVSRARSPGFGFPFRVAKVDIELVEHPGHSEFPVSEEHREDGCLPGPELAFGPTAQIDLHDGPHEHE